MARIYSRLKAIDFFKKIPSDLTEATLAGAWISLAAAVIMVFLFAALVVDRSPQNELLKINFNISFPALSCEFATVDVSDALGTASSRYPRGNPLTPCMNAKHAAAVARSLLASAGASVGAVSSFSPAAKNMSMKRMNLTKTVRKAPINLDLERTGAATDDHGSQKPGPKYDAEGRFEDDADIDITLTLARYPIVMVNFFAPWCHWCQRLEPTWEAATKEVHDKYPEWDGRIRFAKVDCTAEVDLCRSHFIQGFPSIRVFRKGHDDIVIGGMHEHEAYMGDRTKEALVGFADSLVPSAGQPHRKHHELTAAPKSAGCNLAGFVMVKKVPGTIHLVARSEGHSFDHAWMNMSHVIHQFYVGSRPSPRKYAQLKRLHPAGLTTDWADKLQNQLYISEHTQSTHEHYMQIVLTTISPKGSRHSGSYDAYEYVAHSHSYQSDDIPAAKFTFDLSPIQILVSETSKPWYQFLTTSCAIIGGVFTVAGILDAMLYQGIKMMKKQQLGKQG